MEFKTSELSGILLSIAEPPFGSPSLSIEVFNGKVSSLRLRSNFSLTICRLLRLLCHVTLEMVNRLGLKRNSHPNFLSVITSGITYLPFMIRIKSLLGLMIRYMLTLMLRTETWENFKLKPLSILGVYRVRNTCFMCQGLHR